MSTTRSTLRQRSDTVRIRGANATDDATLTIVAAGATHPGHVRSGNQDQLIVDPTLGLYAVLDGMGGQKKGDVAAATGRQQLLSWVRSRRDLAHAPRTPKELLASAIDAAGLAVYAAGQDSEHSGMGSTVVACLFTEPRQMVLAHAGDSRAYLLRDGHLETLTVDHTATQALVDAKKMTLDEAAHSPLKNVLTRYLGHNEGVDPDMLELDLEPGDRLLLCSDGLNGELPYDVIRDVLGESQPPVAIAQHLVDATLAGEARDNVTVVVLAVEAARAPRPGL